MVRRKNGRHQRVDESPMEGTSNLVDAMLVIAVGFLVFIVISWNMGSIIDPNQSIQDQIHQQSSQVEEGQALDVSPDAVDSSSGSGFHEMGKVYKDPSTGKLILVES